MDERWQRRPVVWLSAVAALLLLCAADRPSAPPPPPRPEARDGSLLLDGSSGAGRWTFDKDGVWSAREGALCARLPDRKQMRSFAYAGSEDWRDYAVDLDVYQVRGVDKGVVVRVRGQSGTAVDLRGHGYHDVVVYRGDMPLARARVSTDDGAWHHLRVECRGGTISVAVDGRTVLRHRGSEHGDAGRIALPAYTGGVGECEVCYANVRVTPLK